MKVKLKNSTSTKYILLGFFGFLLVLVVRYWGLNHGYPFIYNSDEPTVIRTMMSLRFFPLPDRFDWPHFNYYFQYAFFWIFVKTRGVIQSLPFGSTIKQSFPFFWADPFVFYALARFINITLSILTAIPIYLSIKQIFKKTQVALIISFLFVFLPYISLNSRYALQDTAMTFWITWGVYFLMRFLVRWSFKNLFIATIFLGLATGVKYNALLFTLLVPLFTGIYLLLNSRSKKNVLKMVGLNLLCGLLFLCVFLMTTPGIIFHWDNFWSYKYGVGFLWQLRDNLKVYSVNQYPAQVFGDFLSLFADTGYVFGIAWLFAPFILIRKNMIEKKYQLGLLVLLIFSFLYAANASRYYLSGSRFYLPIYGIIALGTAATFTSLQKKNLKILFVILCVFINIVFQYFILGQFSRQSTINIFYDRYTTLKEENQNIYIRGEHLERINTLGGMKMQEIDKINQIPSGSYLFIGRLLEPKEEVGFDMTGRIDALYTINRSTYFKDRLGPSVYIYVKN